MSDVGVLMRELEKGGQMSYIVDKGKVAAFGLHGYIEEWHVEIGREDEVIYSVVTARGSMGRGLAGRLCAQIASRVRENGGVAWLDCAVWNTRAHRAFQKAGFVQFGRETYAPRVNRM